MPTRLPIAKLRLHVMPRLKCGSVIALILSIAFSTGTAHADDSIKLLMQDTVTPATNIIWGIPDRPNQQQWLLLDKAAANLEKAALTMKTIPAEMAQQKEWQTINNEFISASTAISKAVKNRDRTMLFNIGNDVLYPTCEGCHQRYLERH